MTYSYEILINNFMYDPCFVFFCKIQKKRNEMLVRSHDTSGGLKFKTPLQYFSKNHQVKRSSKK